MVFSRERCVPVTCPLALACDTFKCTPFSDQSWMEQPCYKCGQVVEEGRPFCPHCMAPQIRVLVAEPVAAPVAVPEASAQTSAALPASETVPVLAVPAGWSQALKPCALAAVVASVLMFLGLNLLVAMLSVGFLAVAFYRQQQPNTTIKAGTGSRLGALGGLFCSGLTASLVAIAAMVPDLRAKLHDQILENAQKWVASHPGDAQVQAALEQLKNPGGFMEWMIIGGVLLLLISIVLGSMGGLLGAAILGRRGRS